MKTWLSRTVIIAFSFIVFLQPSRAQAQEDQQTFSTSTTVGLAHVKVKDYQASTLATISPVIEYKGLSWNFRGTGQASLFSSGTISSYGEVFGQRIIHRDSHRIVAFDAEGGMGTYRGQLTGQYFSSSAYLGMKHQWARMHIGRAYDRTGYSVIGAEFGRTLHQLRQTIATAGLLYAEGKPLFNLTIGSIYQTQHIQFLGNVGVRNNPDRSSFLPTRVWATASASIPVRKQLTVLASVGQTAVDIERGIPEARFISLGMRVGKPSPSMQGSLTPSKTIVKRNRDSQILAIQLENANFVEIRGDFTGWQAITMQRSTRGTWTLPLKLKPGIYSIAIRINGGDWKAPPGVPVTVDDFGETTGILIIP